MDIDGYLSLFGRVLSDWRILFIAVMCLIAWAALRYVGMVYDRRPRIRRPLIRRPLPRAAAPKAAPAPESEEEEEEEGDKRLVR